MELKEYNRSTEEEIIRAGILGDVTEVDINQWRVFINTADRESVPVAYDYPILATGVRHGYFGHDEFEKFAPGIKSLADAVAIRNKSLLAFEQAKAGNAPRRHCELLTFVLVGAGPTGVEMAAAIAVLFTRINAVLLLGALSGAILQNLLAGRSPQLVLLYILIVITLIFLGGGKWSLDAGILSGSRKETQ